MSRLPQDAQTVQTYTEIDRYITAIAERKLNLLTLVGKPGTAKSRRVKDALGNRACYIEGNATPFGMYLTLFKHRDRTVVIDDVDSIYRSPQAIRLLKSLCQSDRVKTVAWNTLATGGDDLPSEFQTTSNVCIISNSWDATDVNVRALGDRGHFIHFDPKPEEIHARVASWFWDREIYLWIGAHLRLLPNLSMRDYVKASELKNSGIDWRSGLLARLSPTERTVVELVRDARYETEKERVQAFINQTASCRATYFNIRKRLGIAV